MGQPDSSRVGKASVTPLIVGLSGSIGPPSAAMRTVLTRRCNERFNQ